MSPPLPPPSLTQGFAFGPRDFMQSLGSNATVIDASGLPETLPWLLRVAGRPPSPPSIALPVLHLTSITHQRSFDTLHGVGRWATNDGLLTRPFVGLSFSYHYGRLRFRLVPSMLCFDILCQNVRLGADASDLHRRFHRPPPFIPPPRHPPWLYQAHFTLGFASITTVNHPAPLFHPGSTTTSSLSSSHAMPTSRKRYRSAKSSGRKYSSTAHHSSPRRKGGTRKRLAPASPSHSLRLRDSPTSHCQDRVRLSGNTVSSVSRRDLSPLTQRRISYEPSSVRGSSSPLLDSSQPTVVQGGSSARVSGQGATVDGRSVSFASDSRSYSDVTRGNKEGGGSTSSRSLASYGFVSSRSPDGLSAASSDRTDGTAAPMSPDGHVSQALGTSRHPRYADSSPVDQLSDSGLSLTPNGTEESSFIGDVSVAAPSFGNAGANDTGDGSQSSVSSTSVDTETALRERNARIARLAAVEEENARRLASLPRIRRTATNEAALACVGLTAEEHQAYEHGIELEEEPHPFLDVLPFGDRISFQYRAGVGRYPVYDALTVKELKKLLKGRDQSTSGNKAKLMTRLHSSDKRTLAQAETERLYKVPTGLTSEERTAFCEGKFLALQTKADISDHRLRQKKQAASPGRPRSRSHSASPRRRSASVAPRARSHTPVTRDGRAESVTSQEDSDAMSVDADAQVMFPNALPSQVAAQNRVRAHISSNVRADTSSNGGRSAVLPSGQSPAADALFASQAAMSMRSDPQDGGDVYSGDMNVSAEARQVDSQAESVSASPIDKAVSGSTATTAESSVTSGLTSSNSGVRPSLASGRLLNTRPRRVVATDGVSNFVTLTAFPAKERNAEPSVTTLRLLNKAFTIFHNTDKDVKFYPIYDQELGEDPLAPISDPKSFPTTLDAFQSWGKVTNPWDLRKLRPGEIDPKTQELKKQKAIYVTVLIGSRLALDHLLDISTASLNWAGASARRKDVDVLDSQTICSLVGIPND